MCKAGWAKIGAALVAALLLTLSTHTAQARDPQDIVFDSVGVDEHLASHVPLNLPFVDQTGKKVTLANYFTGTPVILTLNYYSCPTLCPLIFRNLVDTIHGMKGLSLGKDYRIVTVSIDPEETTAAATHKASMTYGMLGGGADAGQKWSFLLGQQPEIDRLAKSVGMRYMRVGHEFAHPSIMVILTPDGTISRYLYTVDVKPRDLKIALLEASDGKIGGSQILNQALLFCFHYDPVGKKYELIATRIMLVAMIGVLVMLGMLLAVLWQKEKNSPQT
ncbi:SCO family protein [Geomonas sp. RF6]|uniref:SCO family protein n=1 Tax=Geomonas sp. RF6 TaxID=2897342 RepID=UPI001E2A4816|nr:SCO family protein [Geomonas sp. RF6]UFS69534.1 SCO family protein [Geomonas sp. RF6]